MPSVRVESLSVTYGKTAALSDLSFVAEDGEFVTLVGPSGCGKTTTLMAIAGLIQPSHGRIVTGAHVLVDISAGVCLPPEDRNCGVVFQSYAIWPHMSVFGNVAFPLKLRKLPKDQIEDRVLEALKLADMDGYRDRYPHQLSGGQQQRVALARALAYSPEVLLLDEPLSNLDARLRKNARLWLKRLQQEIGLTTIFVTHDQDEALTLSDRVLVLSHGKLEQEGTPEDIYDRPGTPFVAEFIGSGNLLPASGTTDAGVVELRDGSRLETGRMADDVGPGPVQVSVRPEAPMLLPVETEALGANVFDVTIITRSFVGSRFEYLVSWAGYEVTVIGPNLIAEGPARLFVPSESCHVFPAQQSEPTEGGDR